jgi:hypothetical protein
MEREYLRMRRTKEGKKKGKESGEGIARLYPSLSLKFLA